MKIEIRADSVTIEGYVNAVERSSRPLYSRLGQFVEKICSGAFKRALSRAEDVRILLNHDMSRDLGGIKDGNLELEEDNIGLHAKAVISDPEVIAQARNGELVGWSFGFNDREVDNTRDEETGLPFRKVKDLDLVEVSLLNRQKTPAYIGTLVNVRDDGSIVYYLDSDESGDDLKIEDLEKRDETAEEKKEPETEPATKEVSSEYYARYKSQIAELKSLVNN